MSAAAVVVFLAYSHADTAAAAQLRAQLTRAGCAVEMDTDITPGQEWTAAIERMIERANVAAILLSERPASLYVRAEYTRALAQGKPVVPVKLTPAAAVPYPLDALQAIRPSEAAALCRSTKRQPGEARTTRQSPGDSHESTAPDVCP